MITQLDRDIAATRATLCTAEDKVKKHCKQIDYLYLHLELCIEKQNLYRNNGDVVRELIWEHYEEHVDSLIEAEKTLRDNLHETEKKERDKLIGLLRQSIDSILEPFRAHANRHTNQTIQP